MSVPTVRSVAAGRGMAWIVLGLSLFRTGPLNFVAAFALFMLALLLLIRLPYVGAPLAELLTPAAMAGFMAGCRALEQGQPFRLSHLAAGFQVRPVPLITVGGVYLVSGILINQLMHAMAGEQIAQVLSLMQEREPDVAKMQEAAQQVLPAALVGLALLTPLLLATWFAPALIQFDGMQAMQAMGASLLACMRNILPFSLYGLITTLLLLLAMIVPFGLGLLLVGPWVTASTYACYRDVFTQPAG
jgi:hypothetical protein